MPAEPIDKLTRAGLSLIQQALSIFDSDLKLAVCNPRYQAMFGLPDALVTPGASFEDTIRFLVEAGEYGPQNDPDDAVRHRVETARAFQPHYMERQRANGRWISVEGAPLAQGGWVTVYTDITEIKVQEQLLRARSEELSDQVLAHAERLGLANRALASTKAVCVMPKGHALTKLDVVRPQDMAGMRFISFGISDPLRQQIDQAFEEAGVKRDLHIECTLASACIEFVASSAGVSIVDDISAWARRDVVDIRPFAPEVQIELSLYRPWGTMQTAAGSAFTEHLIRRIREISRKASMWTRNPEATA